MRLGSPLMALRGVGQKRAAVFLSAGIRTVGDLLFTLPTRYLDRSTDSGISQAARDAEATVVGEVVAARSIPGRGRRFVVDLRDATGRLNCVWFGGGRFVRDAVSKGDWVAASGKVKAYGRQLQMTHPEIEVLSSPDDDARLHTSGIIPLYRTSAGMKAERVGTRLIRRLVREALDHLELPDFLPRDLRDRCDLTELLDAVTGLHFPATMADVERARTRFAFEELLVVLLWVRQRRAAFASASSQKIATPGVLRARVLEALPFEPTSAQVRAVGEILSDMSGDRPMHRLLQGDVGSGKTLVAVQAALDVVEAGGQVAVMAPTEILAEQHTATIRRLTRDLGLAVGQVTGGLRGSEREAALSLIGGGRMQIVVGTHALLESDVVFRNLAFVVVDEQHRFGVMQRSALREKGKGAHLLVMTATPIPRSLALTLYGDLEVTVIDEMPAGREAIRTGCRPAGQRERAFGFIREEVEAGRQAYVVYPLVETSAQAGTRAATAAYAQLADGPLKGLRLGLLHGKMDAGAKARVMDAFREGEIDVLVATTVVEVGVDVANASVMLIEHAERFGLSQLHQLRGRVGRGAHPSYCILIVDPEGDLTEDARQRLDVMCETTDGFVLAERDLEIRGPGELFGTRQAGLPAFSFADLSRDARLIEVASSEAARLLEADPPLGTHPELARRVAALSEARAAAEGAG